MQLEEYQNKENENPQKDSNITTTKSVGREAGFYSLEDDALYAQVNIRLEPEGESRDTEEESDRGLTTPNEIVLEPKETKSDRVKLYGCPGLDGEIETECIYSPPKGISKNFSQMDKPNNPEELYAAINKVRLSRKGEFPVPDEVWNVPDVKKTLQKVLDYTLHLDYTKSVYISFHYSKCLDSTVYPSLLNKFIHIATLDEDIQFTELRHAEAVG